MEPLIYGNSQLNDYDSKTIYSPQIYPNPKPLLDGGRILPVVSYLMDMVLVIVLGCGWMGSGFADLRVPHFFLCQVGHKRGSG